VRLAADVGGTKTAMALVGDDGAIVREDVAPTHPGALGDFLAGDRPRAACLAVAGPVRDGRARLTNAGWTVDPADFGFPVRLLNDVEAMAGAVSPEGCTVLQGGERRGTLAVIAPGTGLGFAFAVGGRAAPSEAGHAGFAPRDDRERVWAEFLRERFGGVSRERACSGSSYPLLEEFAGGEAPAMFARLLGGIAGDWALSTCATGGLYVAGGMASRFLPHDAFLEAFLDKGRFREFVERVPVYLVTDERLALRGAIAALPA